MVSVTTSSLHDVLMSMRKRVIERFSPAPAGREIPDLVDEVLEEVAEAVSAAVSEHDRQQSDERHRLEESLAKATAAAAVRDEIIAVVSHDLRDPLGVVEGNAIYLDRMLSHGKLDVAGVRQRLDAIKRSSKRMDRLVSDLLDVTRIEGGKLPLKLDKWAVADLINLAAEDMAPRAAAKSLALRTEVRDGAGVVCCDRNRVLQIFANLIGNAVRFTPEGGVISIGVEDMNTEYRFHVRDTGVGIRAAQLPHIFDRFWRSREREPERDKRGTGLGLTIAKGVVELHGGRIWVESEQGHGTTVYFTLPSASAASVDG
jgi:signal transduction histidine kinase